MASKIRVLSDQTINKIAAGEVVENPASVVKELVENAIDAGAHRVTIEILAGGFQLIKISDDGSGMPPDDAVLSIERHATSKLCSADDLFSLVTMGFRGEALASIAAISKINLTTALEDSSAIVLEVEGGQITHAGPAARSRGTTIEVRSLFYNVPARKKFQKSASASSAEITKIVTQLALAHPEIGIELIQHNRCLFSLPAASSEDFLTLLRNRADVLLNAEFLSSSQPFVLKEGNYEGRGLIADPLTSRYNRSGQYLFVNRRPVSCPSISYAIRDAYGTRINTDRHPVYLLHLSIPPELVDVNVHPQKKEIRLRDESLLKYALHSAVNAALGNKESLVFGDFSPSPALTLPAFSEFQTDEGTAKFLFGDKSALLSSKASFTTPFVADFIEPLTFKEDDHLPTDPEIPFTLELNILGLHGRYLLVDAKSLPAFLFLEKEGNPSGIVWFDLSAAEARIQFDFLVRHTEHRVKRPPSQSLLMPLTLNFSRVEMQLLNANLKEVQQLGLQMRQAGDTVFLIEAIPPFLEEREVQKILEKLIGELQGLEKGPVQGEKKLRHLAACVCRRMRSRRELYSLPEARQLVEQLMCSSDPRRCPQGKWTLCHIREEEIENYFTPKAKQSSTGRSFEDRAEES